MRAKIPIKPHLKKWVLKTLRQAEPVRVDEDSMLGLGKMLMSVLVDKRDPGSLNELYTETLEIVMSREMEKRSPRTKYLAQVNHYLEKSFKTSLFTWVHAQLQNGSNAFTATKTFLAHYEIDEGEYTHDAAHRAWLRYKNNEFTRHRRNSQTSVTK
jgi:hypothetical protein